MVAPASGAAGGQAAAGGRWPPLGLLLLRLGLAGLFLVAGALKLRDPAGFAQEIANYQLVPGLAPYLAIVLPPAEIVAALTLAVGPSPWRRAAALLLTGLAALFTFAVAMAAGRGLDISCACFGQGSGAITWLTVARNLLLTAAAATLLWPRAPADPQAVRR